MKKSIVDIRYCEDNQEYYMVIGGADKFEKGAFRVLWSCGLRAYDFEEDIIKDKLIKRVEVEIGHEKNRKNRLLEIINSCRA